MYKINLEKEYKVRFDLGKFLPFDGEKGYDILDSEFVRNLSSLPIVGKYIVPFPEVNRVDLISHKIYGSTQYWWILLLYNGFSSVEEVKNGTSLSYPSQISLENLLFSLK